MADVWGCLLFSNNQNRYIDLKVNVREGMRKMWGGGKKDRRVDLV